LVFSVSALSHGQFELVGIPGVPIVSFTQGQIGSGQIRFVHDGSTSAPTYSISVSDGSLSAGPYAASASLVVPSTTPPVVVVLPPPPPLAPPVVTPVAPAAAPPPSSPAAVASAPGAGSAPFVQHALAGAGMATPVLMNAIEPMKLNIKGAVVQPPTLVGTLNRYEPAGPVEVSLELPAAHAQLSFGPLTPPEWTARFAFPEEGNGEAKQHDQIKVLLEEVQLSGAALSVGVVWWASRISGLVGGLLASTPAWRHIDPLPVLGRDEDEKDNSWLEGEDAERDADELAMSLMLDDGGQRVQSDE
jgi:hypothetical protein